MSTEIFWLTLTVLMTALFWVPYILDRMSVRGLAETVASKSAESGEPHSDWAKRARRAHENAIENLAIFAPLVLIVQLLSLSTPLTEAAVVIYFFTRLAHFIVDVFAVPFLRTLTFTLGWLVQIALIVTILGAA